MSLNPTFPSVAASPKLTININAFNGNTTHFNTRPHPKNVPVQPRAPLAAAASFSSMPTMMVMPA
jgi:hypothetical protein